uniref:DDB1- and CUL4-associated factor 8-like n=1 Tax=Petromyzon marinus TaxID=7757 RepID=A0AAJ7SM13_PETMA|nr:DDB1- and CUL4-associated factor 8-like [Petromyzon marinus]
MADRESQRGDGDVDDEVDEQEVDEVDEVDEVEEVGRVGKSSSSSDSSSAASTNEEAALEVWLTSDTSPTTPPLWLAPVALGALRCGASTPLAFALGARGSRTLVRRLRLQQSLQRHHGCVNTLHFNESGTLLASSGDDLSVVLWNWATANVMVKFESGHRSNVFQAKFLPQSGDSTLVSSSRDGQVRVSSLTTPARGGVVTRRVAQHRGAAHKVSQSLTHSVTHSDSHSDTHSVTQSVSHSLTQSLTQPDHSSQGRCGDS